MILRSLQLSTVLAATVISFAQCPLQAKTISGWVSDERCGADHMEPGWRDCIVKCMRGGASIGHPEWTPQRMVFVRDADKAIFVVSNPADLVGHEGDHVRVVCKLNAKEKSIVIKRVTLLQASDSEPVPPSQRSVQSHGTAKP